MSLRELGLMLIAGGASALLAWGAGLREGYERASRRWRGDA